jgi:hypothetical protein
MPRRNGYYRTAFSCSVMFRNPEKFTVRRDEKAKRGQLGE